MCVLFEPGWAVSCTTSPNDINKVSDCPPGGHLAPDQLLNSVFLVFADKVTRPGLVMPRDWSTSTALCGTRWLDIKKATDRSCDSTEELSQPRQNTICGPSQGLDHILDPFERPHVASHAHISSVRPRNHAAQVRYRLTPINRC